MSTEICGVGVSLVDVPRLRRAIERWGGPLERRVFSRDELAYAHRKRRSEQNLAARFAAKCAGRMALAGVIPGTLRWSDLEVKRRRSGEPLLALSESARRRLPAPLEIRISLTHDEDFAMASVLVERTLP